MKISLYFAMILLGSAVYAALLLGSATAMEVEWKQPCEEYRRIALEYFKSCEESGGISRATNAAFGHFALDMYRECRRQAVTTYAWPEARGNEASE